MSKKSESVQKQVKHNILLTFLIGGPLFAVIVPLLIFFGGLWIDLKLGIKPIFNYFGWIILAILLMMLGFGLAMWAVFTMLMRQGLPLSVEPKGELITTGPYAIVRNPMALGTIMMYLGVAILSRSLTALIVVLIISIVLILHIKFNEEKKLIDKFGQDYLEYKKRVPMLFPKFSTK